MKTNILQELYHKNGNVVKTADLIAEGISPYAINTFTSVGELKRIGHGVYEIADKDFVTDEQIIQSLLPQAIICMESALFHYGYSDYMPREWTVALPRSSTRALKKINQMPIKAYYIQKEYYALGKTTGNFNSATLSIYDRERTICDCFKYKTRIDSEMFNKAIRSYVADEKRNLSNLAEYAKAMKLYEKIKLIMEVYAND